MIDGSKLVQKSTRKGCDDLFSFSALKAELTLQEVTRIEKIQTIEERNSEIDTIMTSFKQSGNIYPDHLTHFESMLRLIYDNPRLVYDIWRKNEAI